MSLKTKSRRFARCVAIASVLTTAATLGLSGTANAAYSSPPASTTDWFGLDLVNDPGGNRHFEVCNYQSTANTVFVEVADDNWGGARVLIQDTVTRNETYGEWVNFNPGGCEGWWVITSSPGDTLEGSINPGNHLYTTGPVRYN